MARIKAWASAWGSAAAKTARTTATLPTPLGKTSLRRSRSMPPMATKG